MFGASRILGGKVVAAEFERRRELAHDARHHGPDPERLLDDGVEVLVTLTGVDLGPKPFELVRMAKQQVERPRERCCRGLVPGYQQRDQLVAKLHVCQRLAMLVTRLQQDRKDVVALGYVLGLPAAADPRRRGPRRHPRGGAGSAPTSAFQLSCEAEVSRSSRALATAC